MNDVKCKICGSIMGVHRLPDHLVERHGMSYLEYIGMISPSVTVSQMENEEQPESISNGKTKKRKTKTV